MNDLFSLEGKRILITGGTRGIGRAISLRFARAGAHVTANHLLKKASAESLKEIAREENLAIDIFRGDISNTKGRGRLEAMLNERNESLDAFIHCAATGVHGPLETLTKRHFDWVLSLNTIAFFELVKMLVPRMKSNSAIVALSSKGARRAVHSYGLVGASKAALEALSRHLAAELATRKIRVNILSPGSVVTDAWDALPEKEKRLDETIRRTPSGRLVTLEEIAYTAQFLCSDAASGVIGHTMVVDGGAAIME